MKNIVQIASRFPSLVKKNFNSVLKKSTFAIITATVLVSGFFVPLSAQALTTLSVISPNGGEEWRGTQSISWSSTGGVPGDIVNIVYSTDDFSSQAVVATGVAYNSTPFSWDTTLFPESATYKIRFVDNSLFVYDTSNAAFMVDNTDPSTALATTTGTLGLDDWYQGPNAPTFDLNCTDSLSGCFDTYYSWDAGTFVLYSSTITALEGAHTLNWYSRDQATDALGVRNIELTHSQVIKVDTIDPTVAVTSTTANGAYNVPDAINVTLTFSEAVTTTDTVTVTLETGATDRTCIVPIMTNSAVGTCTYTVQTGDTSGDLTVNTIAPTTGFVLDVAGNSADLSMTSNLAATSDIVIDTTAPSAFITDIAVTTGGTVVATWWNFTNTGLNVTVPVANDASLTGGTIQLQAEADATFENIGSAYTILVGDLGGSKTISLTATQVEALTGFSETDSLTFRAVITDLATNSTTGGNSINVFVVDQTLPSVAAGTDKEVKALVAQDATISDGGSGVATYAWSKTSGVGTVLFSNLNGVTTNADTNISITDASPAGDDTYVLTLTVTDAAGNSNTDALSFAWDTVAPALAEVTPVPTPTNDTTPNYTFSADSVKQLPANVGGGITYGGTCSSATTNAVAGNNTVTFNALANAVHNTCTIAVTDAAGNLSSTLSITAFEVDTIVATVSSITTTDADLDGQVDTATIEFDDEVNDSTFVASQFSIGGVVATTFTTGTINDNTITISHGGVAGTEAKTVTYTPGTATDLAGNSLGAVSQTSTDAAGPILLSALTTSVTTLTTTWSENLNGGTVNGSGSEFAVVGATVSAATESSAGVVTLTYSALGTGAEPLVTFTNAVTFTDLPGNEAPTPQSVTAVDGVAPVLTVISIATSNANPLFAKTEDTITLTFTSSETITTPTVLIQGFAATTITDLGSNNWSASRVMTGTDTEGSVTFSIVYADDASPTPNAGSTETVVDDSSSVLFDRTNPSVDAGTDKEVNVTASQDATTSDGGSGLATHAWTKISGPGTITFGTPSSVDTTISANTDGTYVLRLTVADSAGNIAFDEITFIWDTTNPEPITSSPSNNTTGVAIAGGTATVTYDEPIVLLDSSRVLLVDDVTSASYKGTVAVSGLSPTVLNIDYSGLNYGTKYRINVKAGNPITGVGAAVRDVAGNWVNTSWTSYFTTVIDTIVPVVNSASAGTITTTGATLSVTTNESATCSYATTDSAYSSMTGFSTTGGTSHSNTLTGLTPSTGYDFYVRCADTSAQANIMTTSASVSFTTLTPDTTAPVITNIQSTSITQTGATITWATDENATSRVEYGLTSAYGSLSAADGTADNTSHSVAITGLSAGTVYHFRVLSTDAASNAGTSVDGTFTTSAPDPDTATPPVPSITTGTAIVNSDSYTISGTAGADTPTNGTRTISVYNGVTLAGTAVVPVGQTGWSVSVTLTQNAANSFTARSTDAAGNTSVPSVAVVITEDENVGADTTDPADPEFTSVDSMLDADTYELVGTAADDDNEVRTITIMKDGVVVGTAVLAVGETDWAIAVVLAQNTDNDFTATSMDASGNVSDDDTVTITEQTAADTMAPIFSNIQAGSITQAGATITWTTNENATSRVEYGPTSSYGTFTAVDGTADNTSHSVAITGLSAGTDYHFRVVSADSLGNIASSTDSTFITAIDDTATLRVTGIDTVQPFATADDTYANGWRWTFHVTVPTSETTFKMKFADLVSGANSIPAASNIRFYSAQSSDATFATPITITAVDTYTGDMTLNADLASGTAGRQIEVTVEVKVPVGTAGGSYSTSYGVESLYDLGFF